MKICLINSLYRPYIRGGAEVYVEKVANELAKNHEVMVITSSPYSGMESFKPFIEREGSIKIYRFYPLNIYYAWHYREKSMLIKPLWHLIDIWNPYVFYVCRKILQEEKPNVVHSHCFRGLSTSALYAIAGLGLPHIHTLHDYGLLCRWNDLMRAGKIISKFNLVDKQYMGFMRRLSDCIDVVLAPSQFILDIHRNHGYFSKSLCIKSPMRMELNDIPEKSFDRIRLLYAGELSYHKGIHLLLYAFKMLRSKDIELHVTGKGPLLDLARRYAEKDHRINCYGFVTDQILRELYEVTNLTVVPSIWYDNCPLVILESFSYGNPVIGSRIGGIPELIKDGYNGFLFETGDIKGLCKILENITENPSKLKTLSENARNLSRRYSLDDHVKKLLRIYSSIAG